MQICLPAHVFFMAGSGRIPLRIPLKQKTEKEKSKLLSILNNVVNNCFCFFVAFFGGQRYYDVPGVYIT